jgi:hypothetical protein
LALGNEQPSITIFRQRASGGRHQLLIGDVLDVLKAHESGVSNCVCFLAKISAVRVEMLAALMASAAIT